MAAAPRLKNRLSPCWVAVVIMDGSHPVSVCLKVKPMFSNCKFTLLKMRWAILVPILGRQGITLSYYTPRPSFAPLVPLLIVGLLGMNNFHNHNLTFAAPLGHEFPGYLSHPSCTVTVDGDTWTAWHSNLEQRDTVVVSRLRRGVEESWTIGSENQIAGPPHLVHHSDGATWVVWQAASHLNNASDRRWHIVVRRFLDGKWEPQRRLSHATRDAIYPAVTIDGSGNTYVVWSEISDNGMGKITLSVHNGTTWGGATAVSDPTTGAAYRSEVDVDDSGNLRVFWDEYANSNYTIKARAAGDQGAPGEQGNWGPIRQVSPPEQYCLKPTTKRVGDRFYVAWLNKRDVIGGPGAISQWHTLQVAMEDGSGWSLIENQPGQAETGNRESTAAELTQGLMAKISPKAVATGGYLGRRTAPILVNVDGTPWILWERKSDHLGSTSRVLGDLVGRPIDGKHYGEAVVLHHGRVDYHVAHQHELRPNERRIGEPVVTFVASQLPRSTKRLYHSLEVDVAKTTKFKKFQQDKWPGWRDVQLPIAAEMTPRRNVEIDGKTYQLFWVDMHCHSGLTADAEGEPDELMHYARDRAALDMVVFTNNDFLYDVPLTGYEYAFSNFFAKIGTRDGFLALPGYEWTSRIPGVRTAPLDDRGNWTPPYQNRSYPNHRSVVFPQTGGPLVRFPEVGNDIRRLNEAVERAGGITLTQHDAFQPSGHAVEVAMELTSGWRNYVTRVPNLFHDPLNAGVRMGFVACGDTHRRAPGLSGALTGVYAEELTGESIFDALKSRRCYATNGSRFFLDTRVDGAFMGREVINKSGNPSLQLNAIGTRNITSAVLIRDGNVIQKFMPTEKSNRFHVTFTDTDLSPGTHWYYWRVLQEGVAPFLPGNVMAAHGHMAWSSPTWVVVP